MDGWMEEKEAVRKSCCLLCNGGWVDELTRRESGWVYGWVGG